MLDGTLLLGSNIYGCVQMLNKFKIYLICFLNLKCTKQLSHWKYEMF